MSTDFQGLTDICTEGAHIGSFRTHNPKGDVAFVHRHYLKTVKQDGPRFARDRPPSTRCLIQGNSTDLHSGVHWRDLFQWPTESSNDPVKPLRCHTLGRAAFQHSSRRILSIGGFSKAKDGLILFVPFEEILRDACSSPHENR